MQACFSRRCTQNLAYLLRDVTRDDEEGQRLKEQIGAGTVSSGDASRLERHFDSIVDYVFKTEKLDLPMTKRRAGFREGRNAV